MEPVKLTFRSRGSAITSAEIVDDDVVCTRFTTPGGKPASVSTDTNSAHVSGVSRAVFTTVVHPAASAAPALRAIISNGKFHGVMSSVGPTG
ncbi:hypothetical protein RKD05_001563 [Microbacterium sp. SLBN-111]